MNICKVVNCANHSKCTHHCIENAGYSLAEFLSGLDSVETQIGDLRKTRVSTRITTGIIIEDLSSPSHILSPLNSKLDNSNKFFTLFGRAPLQILCEYTEKYGLDKDNELKNKLRGIINNKVLVTPVKVKTACTILSGTDKLKSTSMTVEFIKFYTDENGIFQHILISEPQDVNGEQQRLKISLTEYGKSLRLTYIENGLKSSEFNRDCIEITSSGFIKPISFKDSRVTLALDGSYIYHVKQNCVEIVGVWGISDNIIESDKMADLRGSKAYKEMRANLNYISKHKRFIVPYGFIKMNDIVLER